MTNDELLDTIPSLKFTEIQAYLRNTGWTRIETPKTDLALFQKETGNVFFETVLPLSKDFADYKYRIFDVLENISKAENREMDQVLTDLTIPPSDTVRFRVINKDTTGGTISFLDGFNLLENAKKALFTTACDIIQPEKYHRRLGLKGAQQFIEECRLGQTDKGSFIASVICPFVNQTQEDKAQQLSIFSNESDLRSSFTRQVTTRLMRSLNVLKTAIDRGVETEIESMEGDQIISANFLESILELNTAKENSEVEISTNWSAFSREQTFPISSVKFTNDYVPVFETLIRRMKPMDEGIDDVFIGKVSLVRADPDVHARTEGEIVLNYVLGDEEKVSKAHVVLDTENYNMACEAHKNGKTVRVKGRLVSSGRSKNIENPTFEIVE